MFEALEAEIIFSQFVQSFSNASLDQFFLAITWLGNPILWIGIAAFLYWKGDEKKSFFLMTTILFATAVVGILKPLIGRIRPSEEMFRVLDKLTESQYSFPSGHATTIAGVFGYYWEKFARKARITGLIIVLIVLLSRIYLGAHFFGDVLVGALFGFLIGRLVHYFEQNYAKIRFNQKKLLEEIGLLSAIILALLVSFEFRQLELSMGLIGYFAGIFTFKLINMDSQRLSGQKLWIKQFFGFAGLGIIGLTGYEYDLLPIALFIGGTWITFIYPAIYEKLRRKQDLIT
ncbi:MAG: phosphatase PAP2 family protein [archaeon]|nr:phosphatase PAP2 family protein [archaeon]